MRIVLLGPPGAGKGTQAVLLAKERNLSHVSTGEIMRAAVAAGSPLGVRVKSYLDSGELVPDSLVIDLIRERLSRPDAVNSGFVLDGFPRNVDQARALSELLRELKRDLTHVIEISVPETILIERILKRGQDAGRSDDTKEIIGRRLQVFKEQTAPVIDYYKSTLKVTIVDGLDSVDEVQNRLLNVLGQAPLKPTA